MIDLTIRRESLDRNIKKARENNVIIPTIAQMQEPESIPGAIRDKLKNVGLWDVNPLEERSQGIRRRLSGCAQLCGAALLPDRGPLPHSGHGRQVVPHRMP